MKLRKKSEEESSKEVNLPVSFRLKGEVHHKLRIISEVLEKSMSEVIEEVILEAYEAVLKDYTDDVRAEEAKAKKASLKAK